MSLKTLPFRAFSRLYTYGKTYTHRFLYHNPDYLRDELLVTSYFIPQRTLGITRLLVFIYCLVVLVANLVVNIVHGAGWSWAAYFTTLTFFGITLYYGIAAYNTLRYKGSDTNRNRVNGGDVGGLVISQPIPLTSEQRKAFMEDSRMSRFPGMVLSDPSISTGGGSEISEYESDRGVDRVQLLSTEYHQGGQPVVIDRAEGEQRPEIEEIQVFPGSCANSISRRINRNSNASVSISISIMEDAAQDKQAEALRTYNTSDLHTAHEQQQQLPSVLHQSSLATQWILYESFTCYAPLVTLIYWCLLYPSQEEGFISGLDIWMGVSMHACNSVLMALEISVFARARYKWSHIGVMYVFLVLYLVLVYFMVGVYDFYVYPFFDGRYFGGYVAVVCLLVMNVVAIIWVIMLMIHRLRDMLYPKWLSKRRSVFAF
ncbi:hypothetical protein GGF40_002956 [Coemansia sp. RSA 1286]|nr:hypothetical protein IWW45_000543 [Coemansia sp. RSA 485]KAJ2636527.1 hypothetical protein GGF40_002956 [Coemansia sp. RSA 1286]